MTVRFWCGVAVVVTTGVVVQLAGASDAQARRRLDAQLAGGAGSVAGASAAPVANCETLGRPTSLTFRYTGAGCSASEHEQGARVARCRGNAGGAAAWVHAVSGDKLERPRGAQARRGRGAAARDKHGQAALPVTVTPSRVVPGAEITVLPAERAGFGKHLTLEITSPDGDREANVIGTSCGRRAPLRVGDVFGSLVLTAINGYGG